MTSFGVSLYILINWQFTYRKVPQKVQFLFLALKGNIGIVNLF